jgi:hypothetical protein
MEMQHFGEKKIHHRCVPNIYVSITCWDYKNYGEGFQLSIPRFHSKLAVRTMNFNLKD